MNTEVKIWEETIMLPTYSTGKPEKNPMFLEKRVYQGSSGVVYPHAVIEKIEDQKSDQTYQAFFIENDYIKIMVLPQLGGRIHRAYDKIRQRDFIYYNQVIKPALVGLTGPWISGGIEFNWPQHHRPSTFEPIDCTIEENVDGSKTIWVNEVEKMFRTKGMAGFTLYPDKAYIEIKGKLFNRTPFAQTFLWWANPAVKVNDHYQSVFPPDVYAVFDHGKRDVSDFPIATGTYYKVDYSPGTDIAAYKNIPVPTSYMAIQSKYNFMGGYENDTQAGLLHVASHHFSPGKKQWTWGKGDFGFAWDRNLTDEDGPYIELMTGVFTDNQPDFSWLQPNEEKTFEQYFMPYTLLGAVKNATKEAMLNVERVGEDILLKVYATGVYDNAKIAVLKNDVTIDESVFNLSPANVFYKQIALPPGVALEEISIEVKTADNILLVDYRPGKLDKKIIPAAATAAKKPADIKSVEQLYLNGLHLEQYRHATFTATDYYEEALRRDPEDSRTNNAMGLWLLKRGQFAKAEPYFSTAIKTITQRNPNPYDGEAYYNLGCCLIYQNELAAAEEELHKATWNDAWQHVSFLALARLAAIKKDYKDALYLIEKSLIKNYHSHTARALKAALLRLTGKEEAATICIKESLEIDHFNFGCHFENYLCCKQKGDPVAAEKYLLHLKKLLRNSFNNYAEYALDYQQAGMYAEAIELLSIYIAENEGTAISPMAFYYLFYYYKKTGDVVKATEFLQRAMNATPDYCFPNKLEDIIVLQAAIHDNYPDAKALYYLGNLWYDKRQYTEAIDCWEKSLAIDNSFATAYRNLSLAYYNKLHKPGKALGFMEIAFALDTTDGRILMELDQLYKTLNRSVDERLQLLQQHPLLVNDRDDLYLEQITLLNCKGNYAAAKELIAARQFHPWEGGEGKVVGQYLLCHIELAKQALGDGNYENALALLKAAQQYPVNLGEGKLHNAPENDIHYLEGCVLQAMGNEAGAKQKFMLATRGNSEPAQAIFYNDPQPDKIFYQGLAWIQLGEQQKATTIFNRFISFAKAHLDDKIQLDYFAVSLPDLLVFEQDLDEKNNIHCYYLMALGYLGLGKDKLSMEMFDKVLTVNCSHLGSMKHRQFVSL